MAPAGVLRYAALHDGTLAAGLRIAEGVAHFAGVATAPASRRRVIQAALLGLPGTDHHLELTPRAGGTPSPAPTPENLLTSRIQPHTRSC